MEKEVVKSSFCIFTPNKELLGKISVIAYSRDPQEITVNQGFNTMRKSLSSLTITKVPLLSKCLSMAGTVRCYSDCSSILTSTLKTASRKINILCSSCLFSPILRNCAFRSQASFRCPGKAQAG